MTEALDHRHVKLRVIGTSALNERVKGRVFANKLLALISAVEAADRAANGGKRFEFVIVDLKASSASATISEQRINKLPVIDSSVEVFGRCVQSIDSGNYAFARDHVEVAACIRSLAKDVENAFDRAELTVNGYEPILIDRFFLARAEEAINIPDTAEAKESWFQGSVIGTFDGKILESDFRGTIPQVMLRLTAGGKDILCTCPTLSFEDIKAILKQRVRVTGKAYYSGESGIPQKIEVIALPQLVKQGADFKRWRSQFDVFTPNGWSEGN